jgi:ABC-type lipoprotein release transport system permease subunit
MGLILKIAWRNIFRHKGKSLVIGAILFLGALIMTVGNGIAGGMEKGLRKNIVEGFTGDAVLISKKQESDNVFMEFMGKAIQALNNYPAVDSALKALPYVDRWLPAGKNALMHLSDKSTNPGFSFVLGVDFEEYQKTFPNTLKAVEGRLLEPGERGMLMTAWQRKELYNFGNIWCIPEGDTLDYGTLDSAVRADSANLTVLDSLVFMGMNESNATNDVRLAIKGIVKYRALDVLFGHFPLMDIESYRNCMGYFAAAEKVDVPPEKADLLELEGGNLDDLFGAGGLMVENVRKPVKSAAPAATAQAPDTDEGTFNLIMVFFKPGVDPKAGVESLNGDLSDINVRALGWRKAFGVIGSITVIIKSALFIFTLFIFFVAVIIIVNTLSMAALERTNEIGMMRAVGARKRFIGLMFLGETAMLSALFGGLGIAAGAVAVKILAAFQFTSDNDMVQLFFGGDTFMPLLSGMDMVLAVIQLMLVTCVAVLYPLKLARAITPLDAVTRE